MSDDDIIDLTEVVTPGAAPAAGPKPDFGADLDALLQEMGGGPKAAPAQGQGMPGTMNLGTKPADGHVVNPNEEIELPSLSDLDALLEELGVDDAPKQKPAAAAPGFDELDGGGEKTPPASNPNAELEAMLDDLQGAAPQPPRPAAQPAPPPPAGPATQADLDIESILEDAAAATAPAQPSVPPTQPPPAPARPQAPPVQPQMPPPPPQQAAPMPSRPAQPAPAQPQPAQAAPMPPQAPAAPVAPAATAASPRPAPVPQVAPPADDGIDMNELDAMLDQVLSGAPRRPAAPAAAAPVSELDVGSMLDEAAARQAGAAADADDDDILDLELSSATPAQGSVPGAALPHTAHSVLVADDIVLAPACPPEGANMQPQPQVALAELARVEDLEQQFTTIKSENAELEKQFKAIKAENVELKALLAALQTDLAEMRANIERYAARAAAKVIREELTSLGSDK